MDGKKRPEGKNSLGTWRGSGACLTPLKAFLCMSCLGPLDATGITAVSVDGSIDQTKLRFDDSPPGGSTAIFCYPGCSESPSRLKIRKWLSLSASHSKKNIGKHSVFEPKAMSWMKRARKLKNSLPLGHCFWSGPCLRSLVIISSFPHISNKSFAFY